MGRHSPSSRRHRSHRSISPPPREKPQSSSRSAVLSRSGSPDAPPPSRRSRSPSPRTKRLKRIQSERESESKREHDRSHSGSRGRDSERETVERKERKRSDNDDDSGRNGRSSRSKHERSPEQHYNGRSRHSSQSPQRHSSATNSKPRDEVTNSRGAEIMNEEDDSIMKMKAAEEALEEKQQKVKPSFELSGKLAAETNRVRGVTLLFNEPPEARKPDIKWRLYVFKTGEMLNEPLYIHRQSCYLFGRERRVADVPTDHPSCSKQHAVIQFRQIEKEQPDGTIVKQTRPYIMDLGSTNKTFVNDSPIEPQRYYELREQDTIKFGNSSREYVLLHENSAS